MAKVFFAAFFWIVGLTPQASGTFEDSCVSKIVKSYQRSGPVEVDIDEVIRIWSPLWAIFEWKKEYRLIKSYASGGEEKEIKLTLFDEQAKELIVRLGLERDPSPIFANSATWRRKVPPYLWIRTGYEKLRGVFR